MQNKVNPDLWETIVTEHPDFGNMPPHPSEPHIFNLVQENYEKYELKGLMPQDPNRLQRPPFKPY